MKVIIHMLLAFLFLTSVACIPNKAIGMTSQSQDIQEVELNVPDNLPPVSDIFLLDPDPIGYIGLLSSCVHDELENQANESAGKENTVTKVQAATACWQGLNGLDNLPYCFNSEYRAILFLAQVTPHTAFVYGACDNW